jgi:cytochrome c oxidase cbb3-type subunit 3
MVGDATAGLAYFRTACSACHSVSDDLKGDRGEVRRCQDAAEYVPHAGRLVRIDDFLVTLALADGTQRSFRRHGETPMVEIHDPLV